jgi:hypothetical protein
MIGVTAGHSSLVLLLPVGDRLFRPSQSGKRGLAAHPI